MTTPLPPEDEHALLRIAQEGLNNVVKHAGVGEAVRAAAPAPAAPPRGARTEGRGFDPQRGRAARRPGPGEHAGAGGRDAAGA